MKGSMPTLKLSNDRKVSPLSKWQKNRGKPIAKPVIPNAFGLPAGNSCPDMTEWCNVCYADSIQRMYTNVSKLLWHNFDLLKECGSNVSKMTDLLDEAVKSIDWKGKPKVFRWHWSGDIFSKPYAIAIAECCRLNPDIQFYIYTRSFDWVSSIVEVDNLAVYLSVDRYNAKKAKKVRTKFPEVMIAACGDDWDESEELMRTVVGRNAPKCPENTKKIPLVSEDGVGACVACGMCPEAKNHVRFSNKK